MEQRLDDLAAALQAIQEQNSAIQKAVATSTNLFEALRPTMEASVADLRAEIGGVRKELQLVSRNPVLSIKPSELPPLIPSRPDPDRNSNNIISDLSHGPIGHRVDTSPRGFGNGVVTTFVPPPAMGTHSLPAPSPCLPVESRSGRPYSPRVASRSGSPPAHRFPALPRPKMDFPQFWGERPLSWKRNCESYFRVFHIDPSLWVDIASMHFTGAGMLWLEMGELN